MGLKPIFHCDAKTLMLSPHIGLGPQCEICIGNINAKICVTPNVKPQRESVQYRLRWVFWRWGSRWTCTFGSTFEKRYLLAIKHIMLALFWSYVPNMK